MTLVSICIPTHTARRLPYLREAMASALAQTHHELEIILSDNGHDAAIRAFADEQIRKDPRVRYRRNDPSVSMGGNFNAALQAATGKYVIFNGDDDRLLPTCVETLLAAHRHDTVLAFSNHYIIDKHGDRDKALTHDYLVAYARDRLPPGVVADPVACAWRLSLPMPASLIRTADAQRLGITSQAAAGDLDFFIRLAAEGGKFVFVHDFLVDYRVHGASFTSSGGADTALVERLGPIAVPPHVEPIKRRLLSTILLTSVSVALKTGAVREARSLIRHRYYPRIRESAWRVLMQRGLALLPSSMARSSLTFAARARRVARGGYRSAS